MRKIIIRIDTTANEADKINEMEGTKLKDPEGLAYCLGLPSSEEQLPETIHLLFPKNVHRLMDICNYNCERQSLGSRFYITKLFFILCMDPIKIRFNYYVSKLMHYLSLWTP